jgi:putative hemolysin
MKRALAVAALLSPSALIGCPSKDSQSSSGATSPSTATTTGASPTTPSSPPAKAAGPLASLESAPFQSESWTGQEGGQAQPFVSYAQQNVRLSAGCRSASGALQCDAVKALRSATPVEVSKKSLTGNLSAGARACMKLGYTLWSAHSASGNEDGFCKFPDGSMVSTGALEQYGMKIVD